MSNSKKLIVVTDAYLIAAGVEQLSLEINGLLFDCSFSGNEKNLVSKIIEKKPDYVAIDPHSVINNLITLLNELDKKAQVIGIVNSSTPFNIQGKFSNTISIENNKFDLIESLKKVIGKVDNRNDNHEDILSKREKEILRNLAQGKTNQEIANELFLSIHTVMTHRKKITAKLGIKTTSGLTVYAIMNKLVDIREIEN